MITQELKQKIQTSSSFVKSLVESVMGSHPALPAPASKTTVTPLHKTWPKLKYSMWIEEVKQKFKKGDWICRRHHPSILNYCPTAYEILDIQEIHYEVQMDPIRHIPKALYIKMLGTSYPTWGSPDDFRLLTEDERKYANTKPNQTP